ncbi:hypothetical protein ALO86_200272 [Pseudomonas syringae pv. berberidis]|nr:hypothetical protein ALO86_200272 [Pseudomonas syringae pv. berberidis]
MRTAITLGVNILQYPMIPHKRHRRRRHASSRVGLIAVLDHALGEDPEQEVEKIVGIAAHKSAGQQYSLSCLGCQNTHSLALSRSTVFVLVSLVHDQQIETPIR